MKINTFNYNNINLVFSSKILETLLIFNVQEKRIILIVEIIESFQNKIV